MDHLVIAVNDSAWIVRGWRKVNLWILLAATLHTRIHMNWLTGWLTDRSCCFSLQPTNQPTTRTHIQRERQKPDEKKMKLFSISAIILGALPALVTADFDLKDRLRQFRDPSNVKKEVRNSMTWCCTAWPVCGYVAPFSDSPSLTQSLIH